MAHEKNCPVCNKAYWGNINKIFCSDACRKYADRNPEKIDFGSIDKPTISPKSLDGSPQLSGKGRTNSTNLGSYAAKKLMDVVAHKLMNGTKNDQVTNEDYTKPLTSSNLQFLNTISQITNANKTIALTDPFKSFFGNLCFPFRMLVWGAPGQGKSTFCLQLANALAKTNKLIYVSAEEDPGGVTFMRKVNRTIDPNTLSNITVLNRLPDTGEWKGLLAIEPNLHVPAYKHVLYDSLSVLGINPDYSIKMAKKLTLPLFEDLINHTFICHAQKDGKAYLGPSNWGHDVDIVIKVDGGEAIIEKNRYPSDVAGFIGSTIKIF